MSNYMNFNEKKNSGDRFLADFWAEWCPPCKAMEPILEKLSDDITIIKVDADQELDLTRENDVRSLPTMILFENGEEVKRIIGARSYEDLKAELDAG